MENSKSKGEGDTSNKGSITQTWVPKLAPPLTNHVTISQSFNAQEPVRLISYVGNDTLNFTVTERSQV